MASPPAIDCGCAHFSYFSFRRKTLRTFRVFRGLVLPSYAGYGTCTDFGASTNSDFVVWRNWGALLGLRQNCSPLLVKCWLNDGLHFRIE